MMRRLLLLVVVLVLLGLWLPFPTPVLALTYTLTPPPAIVLGPFTAAQDYASADVTVTATTDDVAIVSVDIGVKDISGNAGYLKNGAIAFASALQAKGGDVGTYTDVTGTDIMLVTAAVLVGGDYSVSNFSVQQTIITGDLALAAGTYSTTLTFTATFNP